MLFVNGMTKGVGGGGRVGVTLTLNPHPLPLTLPCLPLTPHPLILPHSLPLHPPFTNLDSKLLQICNFFWSAAWYPKT